VADNFNRLNPQPPQIHENDYWYPGVGIDPAKYLLKPGVVTGPNKHTSGQWAHARPYIANGQIVFVFPVGMEGFQEQGQAQLGIHHYIGDKEADGMTVHYDESRITLSGVFPGLTSTPNMRALRNMLRAPQKAAGLILWVPGVLDQEQYVLPDTWTFNHDEGDRSHSIDYSVTFLRIGTRKRVNDPTNSVPPENPGPGKKPRGKPGKIFTVRAGYRTLRHIAKKVYHDADAWPRLVRLNQGQLNRWKRKHPNIPQHKIPTYRWPLGTKFRY
jgi:hypothetical protein